MDFSASASITADMTLLLFKIGPHIKLGLTLGGGFTKSQSFQADKSVSRSRGFTLSDGDEYDVFDVQVCAFSCELWSSWGIFEFPENLNSHSNALIYSQYYLKTIYILQFKELLLFPIELTNRICVI